MDDLHFAEKEYQHGKKLAERGLVHMGNAIAAAHDALCGVVQQLDNSKHGNRGNDSFRAWCCSIGITKSTAYNLLQVSALMDGSSPRAGHSGSPAADPAVCRGKAQRSGRAGGTGQER